jgi:hypothetical protein
MNHRDQTGDEATVDQRVGDALSDDSVDVEADERARDDDAVPFRVDEDAWQRSEDQALADRRISSIEAGRRKGGMMGAAMAGAMLAIQEIYEGPKKDDMVAVSESPGDPGDIDTDGIVVHIGDIDVQAKLPGDDS